MANLAKRNSRRIPCNGWVLGLELRRGKVVQDVDNPFVLLRDNGKLVLIPKVVGIASHEGVACLSNRLDLSKGLEGDQHDRQ